MVVVGVPALELGVLAALQDVLLALEVGVVVAHEGAALHTDGVHPVHEATVLEVVTVAKDVQLSPGETFPLVEHHLQREVEERVLVRDGQWQDQTVKPVQLYHELVDSLCYSLVSYARFPLNGDNVVVF